MIGGMPLKKTNEMPKNQTGNHTTVPKVMGKITGLNPAIILLSLSVWGALMGIVGMIIALPCTSLMLSYYQRYIRIKEKEFSGGIEHTDFQHKENSNEK